LASVFFFEVKVPKDSTVLSLRLFITEILNHILKVQASPFSYEIQEIILQRLILGEAAILETEFSSSKVTQESKVLKAEDLSDGDQAKDAFTYLNRYILCVPPAGRIPQTNKPRKSILRAAYNPTIIAVLENVKFGFQVRAPRSEIKLPVRQGSPGKKRISSKGEQSQVCNCRIT
jgi:hypothetical protein